MNSVSTDNTVSISATTAQVSVDSADSRNNEIATIAPEIAEDDSAVSDSKKRGRGRPKKSEIEAKLKPGKIGRPKGDFTKARELCARMLVSEGDRMLQTLIKMALTEGHPNQMAALKMCLDRSLPISYFESKDATGPAGGGIVINISGLNAPQIQTSDDVIDVDVNNG